MSLHTKANNSFLQYKYSDWWLQENQNYTSIFILIDVTLKS